MVALLADPGPSNFRNRHSYAFQHHGRPSAVRENDSGRSAAIWQRLRKQSARWQSTDWNMAYAEINRNYQHFLRLSRNTKHVCTLVLALLVASSFLTSSHHLTSRKLTEANEGGEAHEILRRKRLHQQTLVTDERENEVDHEISSPKLNFQLANGDVEPVQRTWKASSSETASTKEIQRQKVPSDESGSEEAYHPVRAIEESRNQNDDKSTHNRIGDHSMKEVGDRHQRFPSADDRVQIYMTNWYLPPCENEHVDKIPDEDHYIQYNYIHNATIHADMILFRETRTRREKIRGLLRHFIADESTGYDLLHFMTQRETLVDCPNSYCSDLVKYLLPAMDRAPSDAAPVPILYQFSDAEKTRAYNIEKQKFGPYPAAPHLKKFRFALSKEERERVVGADRQCSTVPRDIPQTILQMQTLRENPNANVDPVAQPIIFKLKMQRHYGYVEGIPERDIPWSKKKNQAIFRGQFTGRFPTGMTTTEAAALPASEQCQLLYRCRLVYNSATSALAGPLLVDAKLVGPILDVRKNFPTTINGIDLYGDRTSIDDMLSYKAIIMLEGNDVSSGLKWALFSNSVVLTQTPTKTSWAMEEFLEPWIHYVPIADDLADVEEKMQWVLDHDYEAQKIAHRGKLWISDLAFHPDAAKDEEYIFDEILRRYRAHFRHDPTMRLDDVALEQ